MEATMEAALARRTAMLSGLRSAGLALGDAPEPTVRSLQYRLDYCQRTHQLSEVSGLTVLITTLEAIAVSSFQ